MITELYLPVPYFFQGHGLECAYNSIIFDLALFEGEHVCFSCHHQNFNIGLLKVMSFKTFHGFNIHQILAIHTSFDVLGFSRSQGYQKSETKLQVVFSVSWCVLSSSTFKLYLIAQYVEKIVPMALCDVSMYFKGNN